MGTGIQASLNISTRAAEMNSNLCRLSDQHRGPFLAVGCEIRGGIHKDPDITDFQQVERIQILAAQYEVAYACGCVGDILAGAASISLHVELGNHEYFLPPQPAWSFSTLDHFLMSSSDDLIPLTVICLNTSNPDASLIKATSDKYREVDDVWTPHFMDILYIQSASTEEIDTQGLVESLADHSVSNVFTSGGKITANEIIAPGPYFVNRYTGNVHQAYKLYPDTNQAFLQSSYQDPDGVHHNLRVATPSAAGLTVAVPSRLYFTPSKPKPLAGLRIAIKDLFDLRGMKTSGGNRALFEMSEAKSTTAVAVQKLIDAGAVIVGKNKISEFAYSGGYHTDHIDYLLPFNPRGDGYNSPGDSSGGSGASVASYEWLDASLGSDTGGSIRGPASQNGVFGSRPSHGAVNMTGSLVLSNSMDTGGVLVRDPKVWSKINKVLYSRFAKEYSKLPKRIYVNAEDIQSTLSPVQSIGKGSAELVDRLTNFTARLASFVHGNITSLSLDEAWDSTNHQGDLKGTSFADLTISIYGNLTYYEQWTSFGQRYISEYQKSHQGKLPYMSNSILNGWQIANSTITPAIHKESLRKKQQIANWASNNLFRADQDTCSDSIFLYFAYLPSAYAYKPDVAHDTSNHYISGLVDENTRLKARVDQLNTTLSCNCTEFADATACSDLTAPSQEQQSGTTLLTLLASLGDLPDYTVTLGDFALPDIDSEATKKPQALPYGVGIVARHGCEFMVQNLISGLHEAGVIQDVKAGSSVYGSW